MSSRAEKQLDVIENYYHIIDPEGTLSEIERAKKEAEILNDMPNSFPIYTDMLPVKSRSRIAYDTRTAGVVLISSKGVHMAVLRIHGHCCTIDLKRHRSFHPDALIFTLFILRR